MGGEACGQSTGGGREPEVAGVSENNFVAVNIRKAKKLGLSGGSRNKKQSSEKQQKGCAQFWAWHDFPFTQRDFKAGAADKTEEAHARSHCGSATLCPIAAFHYKPSGNVHATGFACNAPALNGQNRSRR
jgi:hypothetical protein